MRIWLSLKTRFSHWLCSFILRMTKRFQHSFALVQSSQKHRRLIHQFWLWWTIHIKIWQIYLPIYGHAHIKQHHKKASAKLSLGERCRRNDLVSSINRKKKRYWGIIYRLKDVKNKSWIDLIWNLLQTNWKNISKMYETIRNTSTIWWYQRIIV